MNKSIYANINQEQRLQDMANYINNCYKLTLVGISEDEKQLFGITSSKLINESSDQKEYKKAYDYIIKIMKNIRLYDEKNNTNYSTTIRRKLYFQQEFIENVLDKEFRLTPSYDANNERMWIRHP